MEFKKVYSADFETVYEHLLKFDQANVSKEERKKLFIKQWNVEEDFFGIMVIDKHMVIAYLGLVFSKRNINGEEKSFCNLSGLMIDEKYRGQKLTHKIVQYLQSLGDYTLTAITPIPSLYGMYKSNGFVDLNDYRCVFWKHPFLFAKSNAELVSEAEKMESLLKGEQLQIYRDHRQFNCLHLIFRIDNCDVYLILKHSKKQRRKLITNKALNYLDWLFRKMMHIDLLSKLTDIYEIHYCSNYLLLTKNINVFAALFFRLFKAPCFCMRKDFAEKHNTNYLLSNEFFYSRQMFRSSSVSADYYDTLYSEIFVLDM